MSLYLREERSLWERPLRRSMDQRICAGVCGGLAEWLGWDVTLVRLGVVGLALMTSLVPIALLYIVLAFVIPEERPYRRRPRWDEFDREF